MSWNDYTYLIGEKVKVAGEKDFGVVTRINIEKGLICVLFKRMREEIYAYPEALDEKLIIPLVEKRN